MEIIDELIYLLGADRVVLGEDLKSRYVHIWQMEESLLAKAVLLPIDTTEVSEIMKIAFRYEQIVVVHGGLTNLVSSTNTQPDDLVISMEKMNHIQEVDPESRAMTVQAGTILENIHLAAQESSLLFPLSYGAKGSAQIGGAISTNAGGLRVLKYGMTRSLVLGLEIVLANGTILSSLKKIIKDNSGYDLKQLFIGSEGTLGIVTRAILKLEEAPISRVSALVGMDNYTQVIQLLKYLDAGMAGTLSGFELIFQETYAGMTNPSNGYAKPLVGDWKFLVLIEGLGGDQKKNHERLEGLLSQAMEQEMISDGVMAHSESDLEWFWKIREDVHVIIRPEPFVQLFDVSVPIGAIGAYAESVISKLQKLTSVTNVYTFGHVADGNMHFIVGKMDDGVDLKKQINDIVYLPLKELAGSVSAEHGIGLDKKEYLSLSKSQAEIELMKKIKLTLDPKNLLNRGKIF